MPEGPELHLASLFVNKVCAGVVFSGAVEKSEVSKGPQVAFASVAYCITAVSRGKEVRLTLAPIKTDKVQEDQSTMDVVFRFGMSGSFQFTTVEELPKHAHVRFYTNEKPQQVLSFVDTRRFGSWEPNGTWQRDRGPCIMFEYESFRQNVLSNLSDKAFDRPICEALLNQKFFNGIGNYLRAEILYRSHVPPFVKARTVLEALMPEDTKEAEKATEEAGKRLAAGKSPDILFLCHAVPLEVVNLGGKVYDPQTADYTGFKGWLQCYSVDGMNSMSDRNGRTIWFKGVPGPMAPKGSSKAKRKIHKGEHEHTDTKKAVKNKQTAKDKTVKKDPATVKKEDLPKRHRSTRRQNANENRLDTEAEDENRGYQTRRKSSTAGSQTSGAKSKKREANTKAKGSNRSKRNSRTAALT